MVDLLSLYLQFIKTFMKSKLEYRVGFSIEMIANLTIFIVYYGGIKIIFHNFQSIAGWDYNQVVFLFSFSWINYSIAGFLFWQPMLDMGNIIQSGELDLYLTRPMSPLKYLVFKQFQYTFIARLAMGGYFMIESLKSSSTITSWKEIILIIVFIIIGTIINSCILICIGALGFWFISNNELGNILTNSDYGLRTFSEYPLSIYPKIVQIILIFVIPFAFTNYFPVTIITRLQYYSDKDLVYNFFLIIGTMLIWIVIAGRLWNQGLKRYESTGN